MGGHPGHPPQEAAGDVPLADGEGGRQVLRLGQNLRVRRSCAEGEKSRGGVETRTHERKVHVSSQRVRELPDATAERPNYEPSGTRSLQ